MTYDELAEKVAEFFAEEPNQGDAPGDVLPPLIDETVSLTVEEEGEADEGGEEEEEEESLVVLDSPAVECLLPIVLSLSERVDALALALDEGLLDPSLHTDPENFTISALYDRARQGAYVGQLYTNTDTGEDYKIVRDGKEYWL